MNGIGALSFIACVAAAAVAPALAQPLTADRAYGLVGKWLCQSSAAGAATLTFTRERDGSMTMRNLFTVRGGAAGEFDEKYWLVTPGDYWSWTATQPLHEDFKEAATAGPWTAPKWFFDGTVTQRPHPHDTDTHRIRMIYTWISDATFEREFELYDGDVWKTTSSSVCKRSEDASAAPRSSQGRISKDR